MKDGKRGFFILLAVFVILAISQTYITTEDEVVKLINFISTYVVIVGTIVYGIGIFKKIKAVNYLGMALLIGGYIYSIVELFSKYPKFDIELGILIYALSLIAFIVSIFMPDTVKLEINEAEAETVTIQNDQVVSNEVVDRSNEVVFGSYISGIPKRPELSKKVCLLGYRDDLGKFSLFITNGDKVETFDFSYGIVNEITSRQRVVMEQKDVVNEDNTQDKQTLATEVAIVYGNDIANNIVNGNKDSKQGVSYNDLYELNMTFKVGEETRKLILNIDKDPTEFINRFNGVDKSNTEAFKMVEASNEEVVNSEEAPVIDVTKIAQTEEVKNAMEEENKNTEENLLEEDTPQEEVKKTEENVEELI